MTEALPAISELRIFPNPGNGSFVLEHFLTGKIELSVFDIAGRLVFTEVVRAYGGPTQEGMNLSELAKGTCAVQVQNAETMAIQRVVVE